MWNAELLTEAPLSGEYTEVLFSGTGESYTWIKFDNGVDCWAAAFSNKLDRPALETRIFVDENRATILNDERLYIIDLEQRSLLKSMHPFQDIITDGIYTFAANGIQIQVFENLDQIKVIPGYYFDSFRFVTVDAQKVYFKFYQYGGVWQGDALDRESLQLDSKRGI